MGDDTRDALGAAPLLGEGRALAATEPSLRPLALAALVGLVLAAVPSLGYYLLSAQTINDVGAHARPLIALVVVAPLAAVMLAAAAADWFRGRGSPLAAVRQLSAIALVAACFFAAVLGMVQQDILEIVGGFMLIGGAIGLGIAFALGGSADYSGPVLAMVGWVGCALLLILQFFVYTVTYTPTPTSSRFYLDSRGLLQMVCGGAFLAAIAIGATMVPLGGWLGSRLRGHG